MSNDEKLSDTQRLIKTRALQNADSSWRLQACVYSLVAAVVCGALTLLGTRILHDFLLHPPISPAYVTGSLVVSGLVGIGLGVIVWRNIKDILRSDAIKKFSAETQCESCRAPFSVQQTDRRRALLHALQRHATSSSNGTTYSGNNERLYVDVTTTTWTEETYEVTSMYVCVTCGNQTEKKELENRNTNRNSGTERKYY